MGFRTKNDVSGFTILAKIADRSTLLILPQLSCIHFSLRLGRGAGAGEENASGIGLLLWLTRCGFIDSHEGDGESELDDINCDK